MLCLQCLAIQHIANIVKSFGLFQHFRMGIGLFYGVSSVGKEVEWPNAFLVSVVGGILAVGTWAGAGLWWSRHSCSLGETLVYNSWSHVIWLGPILFVPVYLVAGDYPAPASEALIQILLTTFIMWLVLKAVLFSDCVDRWNAFLEHHTVPCLNIAIAALLS